MKKIITLGSLLFVFGCATATNAGNGINRLETRPDNCEFLYTLDSSVTSYKLADAYDYVEKMILEQQMIGDSYYISNENITENIGAVFGPKETFKLKAEVYNCTK